MIYWLELCCHSNLLHHNLSKPLIILLVSYYFDVFVGSDLTKSNVRNTIIPAKNQKTMSTRQRVTQICSLLVYLGLNNWNKLNCSIVIGIVIEVHCIVFGQDNSDEKHRRSESENTMRKALQQKSIFILRSCFA